MMAVTTKITRVRVSIKLDAGEDSTAEKTITKSVSLGSLKADAFDEDKVMNVVKLLDSCFEYSRSSISQTITKELKESA